MNCTLKVFIICETLENAEHKLSVLVVTVNKNRTLESESSWKLIPSVRSALEGMINL